MKKLPFNPLPPAMTDRVMPIFLPMGEMFGRAMPGLKENLYQADIDMNTSHFVSTCMAVSFFYAFMVFFMMLFLALAIDLAFLLIGFGFSAMFFFFMLFSTISYPSLQNKKRMRKLEAHLVPALRHLLIEVRSGVPLFQSMMGVTNGYGEVSAEFSKIVTDINTGKSETESINDAARRNSSFRFRRSLWQITNALKSGSDIGDALQAIIDDLSMEQVSAIKKYGQELNPWTMIYMVVAVIIPSLGLTFLVVISAFTGAMMPPTIFPLMLFGLVLFQVFFMNFVKSRRPTI